MSDTRPLSYGNLLGAIGIGRDHCAGCGEHREVYGRIFQSQRLPVWLVFCQQCELAISVVLPALLNQTKKTNLWCTICGTAGHDTEHFNQHRPPLEAL